MHRGAPGFGILFIIGIAMLAGSLTLFIKVKRQASEKADLERKIKASQEAAISFPKLEHFVELIREKPSGLDFETKRMALEMLDIKVWIDDYNVEMAGVIPISDYVIATMQMGIVGTQ